MCNTFFPNVAGPLIQRKLCHSAPGSLIALPRAVTRQQKELDAAAAAAAEVQLRQRRSSRLAAARAAATLIAGRMICRSAVQAGVRAKAARLSRRGKLGLQLPVSLDQKGRGPSPQSGPLPRVGSRLASYVGPPGPPPKKRKRTRTQPGTDGPAKLAKLLGPRRVREAAEKDVRHMGQ